MNSRRIPILGAAVAVLVVAVALVVISGRSGSAQRSGQEAAAATASTPIGDPNSDSMPEATAAQVQQETESLQGPYTTPDMPLTVEVSSATEGLRPGDVVSAVTTPSGGSQAFAVEARLCRGDVAIMFDAEMFPTRAGLCIAKPFVEGTDSFVEIVNRPPYGPITVKFRVGTGTQTFTLQDASQTSITCDATTPCQLVLKMHYPNGFGFKGIPLTFA